MSTCRRQTVRVVVWTSMRFDESRSSQLCTAVSSSPAVEDADSVADCTTVSSASSLTGCCRCRRPSRRRSRPSDLSFNDDRLPVCHNAKCYVSTSRMAADRSTAARTMWNRRVTYVAATVSLVSNVKPSGSHSS